MPSQMKSLKKLTWNGFNVDDRVTDSQVFDDGYLRRGGAVVEPK
jgi:hypothetical protein